MASVFDDAGARTIPEVRYDADADQYLFEYVPYDNQSLLHKDFDRAEVLASQFMRCVQSSESKRATKYLNRILAERDLTGHGLKALKIEVEKVARVENSFFRNITKGDDSANFQTALSFTMMLYLLVKYAKMKDVTISFVHFFVDVLLPKERPTQAKVNNLIPLFQLDLPKIRGNNKKQNWDHLSDIMILSVDAFLGEIGLVNCAKIAMNRKMSFDSPNSKDPRFLGQHLAKYLSDWWALADPYPPQSFDATWAYTFHIGDIPEGIDITKTTVKGLKIDDLDLNRIFSDYQKKHGFPDEGRSFLQKTAALNQDPVTDDNAARLAEKVSMDHYGIIKVLGKTSESVVVEAALKNDTTKHVALKFHFFATNEEAACLKNEIMLGCNHHHPLGIAQYGLFAMPPFHDTDPDTEDPRTRAVVVSVLQLAGNSLNDCIKELNDTEFEVAFDPLMMKFVAACMAASSKLVYNMHHEVFSGGEPTAHRDLRPENFLMDLSNEKFASVSDYGVSEQVEDSGFETLVNACTYYVPSEEKDEEGVKDYSRDVFAWGVTQHKLGTGSFPSRNVTEAQLFKKFHQCMRAEPGREVHTSLIKILSKIVHSALKNPRWSIAQMMVASEAFYRAYLDNNLIPQVECLLLSIDSMTTHKPETPFSYEDGQEWGTFLKRIPVLMELLSNGVVPQNLEDVYDPANPDTEQQGNAVPLLGDGTQGVFAEYDYLNATPTCPQRHDILSDDTPKVRNAGHPLTLQDDVRRTLFAVQEGEEEGGANPGEEDEKEQHKQLVSSVLSIAKCPDNAAQFRMINGAIPKGSEAEFYNFLRGLLSEPPKVGKKRSFFRLLLPIILVSAFLFLIIACWDVNSRLGSITGALTKKVGSIVAETGMWIDEIRANVTQALRDGWDFDL